MKHNSSTGFTLIEFLITMGILLSLTIASTTMLRSGIDLREATAERSRVTSRISRAMLQVVRDLENAYIVPTTDTDRGIQERKHLTVFKLEKSGEHDKISLTTFSNDQKRPDMAESDIAYVVYEAKDSVDITGRKDLYRSALPFLLKDSKDTPQGDLLAKNIKSFKIIPWTGDSWSQDRWDSGRSETRNKLPHMVRIEIETWAEDPKADESVLGSNERPAVALKTIVRLPLATIIPEMKSQTGSIKWF